MLLKNSRIIRVIFQCKDSYFLPTSQNAKQILHTQMTFLLYKFLL